MMGKGNEMKEDFIAEKKIDKYTKKDLLTFNHTIILY